MCRSMADRHDSQIRQGIANNTKGTAFVVYEDVMDAKQACDKLNGFNFQNRYLVGMPETMLQTNGFIRVHARANWCKFSTINQKRWQNPKKIWPNDKRTWRSLKSSTALTELMVSVCVCLWIGTLGARRFAKRFIIPSSEFCMLQHGVRRFR